MAEGRGVHRWRRSTAMMRNLSLLNRKSSLRCVSHHLNQIDNRMTRLHRSPVTTRPSSAHRRPVTSDRGPGISQRTPDRRVRTQRGGPGRSTPSLIVDRSTPSLVVNRSTHRRGIQTTRHRCTPSRRHLNRVATVDHRIATGIAPIGDVASGRTGAVVGVAYGRHHSVLDHRTRIG